MSRTVIFCRENRSPAEVLSLINRVTAGAHTLCFFCVLSFCCSSPPALHCFSGPPFCSLCHLSQRDSWIPLLGPIPNLPVIPKRPKNSPGLVLCGQGKSVLCSKLGHRAKEAHRQSHKACDRAESCQETSRSLVWLKPAEK